MWQTAEQECQKTESIHPRPEGHQRVRGQGLKDVEGEILQNHVAEQAMGRW